MAVMRLAGLGILQEGGGDNLWPELRGGGVGLQLQRRMSPQGLRLLETPPWHPCTSLLSYAVSSPDVGKVGQQFWG